MIRLAEVFKILSFQSIQSNITVYHTKNWYEKRSTYISVKAIHPQWTNSTINNPSPCFLYSLLFIPQPIYIERTTPTHRITGATSTAFSTASHHRLIAKKLKTLARCLSPLLAVNISVLLLQLWFITLDIKQRKSNATSRETRCCWKRCYETFIYVPVLLFNEYWVTRVNLLINLLCIMIILHVQLCIRSSAIAESGETL